LTWISVEGKFTAPVSLIAFCSVVQGAYAKHWCKGRDELAKGTDLLVCLELLRDDLHDCLGAAFAGAAEE